MKRSNSSFADSLWSGLWAVTLLASISIDAQSAELRVSQVRATADGYHLRTEVMIAARASEVRDALGRYDRLPTLNPNIESVERLESSPTGETRLLIKTKSCLLFFCQRYQWIQRVSTEANGDIVAVIEPANGDFRRGAFHYRFHPVGDNCLLITEARLEPRDMPRFGRLHQGLMKYALGQEAVMLSIRLERLLASRPATKSPTAT